MRNKILNIHEIFVLLIWLAISAFHHQSFAQTQVQIYGYPAKAVLHIDGTSVASPPMTITLTPGEHSVKMWSPGYNLLDTLITVRDTTTQRFAFRLHHSQAWHDYMVKLNTYKTERTKPFLWGAVTLGVIGAGGAGMAGMGSEKANLRTEILQKVAEYDAATEQVQIDALREQHAGLMEDYQRLRKNQMFIGGAVLAVTTVCTFKMIQTAVRSGKLARPTLDETPLLSISPTASPLEGHAGLQFTFTF